MIILQILFSLGLLGIFGFGFYKFGTALKKGPEDTRDQVNNDPRFK